MWVLFCSGAVLCAAPEPSPQVTAATAPVIPAAYFFSAESQETFRLSPKGERVAFLRFDGNGSALCVGNPENLGDSTCVVTDKADANVLSFLWVEENCLAFTARTHQGETRVGCAHLSESAGDNRPRITIRTLSQEGEKGDIVTVISGHDSGSARVVISVPTAGDQGINDLYKVDPMTGALTLLHKNVEGISVWNVSRDGNTLAGIRCHTDGRLELLRFSAEGTQSLLCCDPGETLNLSGMSPDGAQAYVVTNNGKDVDRSRLEAIDIYTGARTVLAEDPEGTVDFGEAIFDRLSMRLLAARYFRRASECDWKAAEAERPFARMMHALPENGDLMLKEFSDDGKKALLTFTTDTRPEAAFYCNSSPRRLVRLDSRKSKIPTSSLGSMRCIEYKARDGREISGYLTIPPGVPECNLPLVVFPHGGPNKRNYWGYDARVQFFASRGYAVFQPNFRGSSGFGKEFQNAGNKQWGRGVMQDDITDGVTWLVAQGTVDPKRVAIVGGSYGGYAALAGLAFTPDIYAAGVCLFGASDLPNFIREVPPHWKPFLGDLSVKIGDPDDPKDVQRLAWQSPIHATDQIKAPVFVYHGAKDELIKKSQADRFVAACRSSGVRVEYLVSPREGHGFADPLDEQAVYIAIERFLAEHIGGKRQRDVPREVEERIASLHLSVLPKGRPDPLQQQMPRLIEGRSAKQISTPRFGAASSNRNRVTASVDKEPKEMGAPLQLLLSANIAGGRRSIPPTVPESYRDPSATARCCGPRARMVLGDRSRLP